MSQYMVMPEVLTLEEVANYLRLSPDIIEKQAVKGNIPGRRIEDTWRFLKTAVDNWLQSQDSRTVLLQQAGTLRDDTWLPELRSAIQAAAHHD